MFGDWILDNNAVPRGFSTSHDFREDGKPNSPRDGLYTYYYSYNAADGSFKKMWSCENREACFHPTTFDFDNRHLFGVGQAINEFKAALSKSDKEDEKKVECGCCEKGRVEKVISSFSYTSDLSTDPPKPPGMKDLPKEIRGKLAITDYIEEKDRPHNIKADNRYKHQYQDKSRKKIL